MAKPIGRRLVDVLRQIGQIQTWLLLTVFYFVVMSPVATIFKWLADPLHLRKNAATVWYPKPTLGDRLDWAKTQS